MNCLTMMEKNSRMGQYYPCTNCESGWGSNTDVGCSSCKDDCVHWKWYDEAFFQGILRWKCGCGEIHVSRVTKAGKIKLECPHGY